MFRRMIEDVKESTGSALRQTSLAAAVAFALFVMIAFLCAAAFVAVLQTYGAVQACLAGAGVFAIVALIALYAYLVNRKKARIRAAEAAKPSVQSALADPMVLAAGLQVVRTIGVKRLLPLIAIGGVVLGILTSRHSSNDAMNEAPAE
jgi:hypothetical protein